MIETNNVVERLRGYCIDWTGEQIVDESTPRVEIYCGTIREAANLIQSLSDHIDELEVVGNALIAKLDECEPHITNAFAMEHFRGRPYSGPQYKDELTALRASLTQGGKNVG